MQATGRNSPFQFPLSAVSFPCHLALLEGTAGALVEDPHVVGAALDVSSALQAKAPAALLAPQPRPVLAEPALRLACCSLRGSLSDSPRDSSPSKSVVIGMITTA